MYCGYSGLKRLEHLSAVTLRFSHLRLLYSRIQASVVILLFPVVYMPGVSIV